MKETKSDLVLLIESLELARKKLTTIEQHSASLLQTLTKVKEETQSMLAVNQREQNLLKTHERNLIELINDQVNCD